MKGGKQEEGGYMRNSPTAMDLNISSLFQNDATCSTANSFRSSAQGAYQAAIHKSELISLTD